MYMADPRPFTSLQDRVIMRYRSTYFSVANDLEWLGGFTIVNYTYLLATICKRKVGWVAVPLTVINRKARVLVGDHLDLSLECPTEALEARSSK
jgi:hypothetical protein